ncbi:MAG: CRP-like cAMP-binding protein [Bradymonadia bacterium]|jgi:CRP-like cAMP-binding protein
MVEILPPTAESMMHPTQADDAQAKIAVSESAVRSCLAHMRRAPLDYRLRGRAAELLIGLGRRESGFRILRSCVDAFTFGGFPLRALWSIKLLELHGGPSELIERGYSLLTGQYARAANQQWGDPIFEMATPAPSASDLAALPDDFSAVVAEIERRAIDIIRGAHFPDRLPRFALLSDLPAPAFRIAAEAIHLRRMADGEVLLTEGEAGDSVHIIVFGEARVVRMHGAAAAELGCVAEGDVFGEMALVTDSPRIATVSAMGAVEAFELKRGVLDALGQGAQSLLDALARQVCDRMVGNLMRLSSLFNGLDAERRGALITRFESRLAHPGEAIITEGEHAPGLFIVLDGRVQVSVQRELEPQILTQLREGDVFGEISLVRGTPATATCTAVRRTMLMWLPGARFAELSISYPKVVQAIAELGEYRLLDTLYTLA